MKIPKAKYVGIDMSFCTMEKSGEKDLRFQKRKQALYMQLRKVASKAPTGQPQKQWDSGKI